MKPTVKPSPAPAYQILRFGRQRLHRDRRNTTAVTLNRARMEIHLSNGIELGPATPINLSPSQSADITLPMSDEPWSASGSRIDGTGGLATFAK